MKHQTSFTWGGRLAAVGALLVALTTNSGRSANLATPASMEVCGTTTAWLSSPEGKTFMARAKLVGTCPTFGSCDVPANRDAAIPSGGTPVKIARLRFQVFANDDGSNVTVTPAEIAAQVDKLNIDFEVARIQFVYSIRTNLSTLYRNCPSNAEPAMKAAFSENAGQQMNIFVTRYTFGNCGIATFPFTAASLTSTGGMTLQDWSVAPVRNGYAAGFAGCISHEMGHMFGLLHTFRGTTEWTSNCQDCKELSGRDTFDGDRTGDFCSDTPPDPGLTVITGPCNPTGTDSCNSLAYTNIDTLNIMSYYIGCQTRFTAQQQGRMHCWMNSALAPTYFFDTVNPGISVTTPTNGTVATSVATATGTASDDNAVKRVRVALARTSDGAWWDWIDGAFGSTTFDFVRHTSWANGTSAWTKSLPLLPSGAYQVHAQSVDLSDNSSSWQLNHFSIDTSIPTIAFSPLTNQQVVFNFEQIGGTISEAGTVKFKIEWFRAGGNEFWNGVNWSSDGSDANALLPANVAGLNWTPAATLPSRAQSSQGNYLIHASVTDPAGNTNYNNLVLARSALDTTPPLATINIGEAEVFTNNFLPPLRGLAGDAESGVDLVTMYFARRVAGGFEYWNGSSWSATASPITLSYVDFLWGMPGGTPQPSGSHLRNGSYNIQVIARNREVPALSGSVSVNFIVEWHPVYTWTAGSFGDADPFNNNNNWDNPANWSPSGVPPEEANVFVNGNPEARPFAFINLHGLTHSGGTLYSSNITVKFLTQSGGRIHCENILQLGSNGVFRWNGGEFYGGAAKLGSLNVPTSGTAIISNAAGKAVYSATFNNSGTVRWHEGNIYGDECVINNGPTGLWEAHGAYTMNTWPGFGAGNRGFINHGTFRKRGSVDAAHQGYFNNFGLLEAEAGVFSLYDAMRWENGSRISGGGVVRLINGCCGATATVAGDVTIEGTFDLNEWNTYLRGNGNVTLTSNAVLKISAGYVGGNVNLSGPGQIAWTGGGFDGTNTLNTTVNVTGSGTKQFNRPNNPNLTFVNNQGVVNWSGTGPIYGWARSAYAEKPGTLNNFGTFRLHTDGVPFVRDGDYSIFNNYGVLEKVGGTNETTFHSFRFNNHGSAIAHTGTLAFVDQVNLLTNSALHGLSRIRLAGTITASNVVTASGLIRMDGGWLYAVTNTNSLVLSAWLGTNTFEWTGGTLYGHLIFGSNVVMNIAEPAGKYLGSLTTIDNFGQVNWLGGARVHAWARAAYAEFASTFNNRPGATFRLASDGYPFARDGDYTRFTNHAGALVVKTAGTNRSTIDSWRFANSGEVRADVGTIEFSDVLHMQPGGLFTGSGAHLISAGNHTLHGTNTMDGTTVQHSGGWIVCNSNSVATLRTINNGLWNWSGGALAERVAWAPGSTFHITGAATKQFGSAAVLDNSAYVRWLGTGHIWNQGRPAYAEQPATWNNLSGAVFDIWEDSAFSYDGLPCTFNNLAGATFRKTGGTNTIVYWILNNAGAVQSYWGRIELAGGGTGSGTFFTDAGARTKFTGGNYTLANATLTGNGLFQVDGATVTTAGNIGFGSGSAATLELMSGAINGAGSLVGNPVLNWTGGSLGGTQHIVAGSIFNISGGRKYLASATILNNAGIVNWSGPGDLYAWARPAYAEVPSTINNLAGGTFRFLTEGAPFVRDGNYSYFNNHGTLVKAGGSNETTIHSFILNNYGSIVSQTGTLAFVDYLNLGANSQLHGESRIRLAGLVTASNTVTAIGLIRMDGGWFNFATNANGTTKGSWLGANTFDWIGGTLYGHHTLGADVVFNIGEPAGAVATKFLGSLTTIDNHGEMNWFDRGRVQGWARSAYGELPSTLNNMPGATFRFMDDGYPFARDGNYSLFTNHTGALVVKTGGTNRTTIDSWQFANSGEVRADSGTIEFTDIAHLQPGGSFTGAGTHQFSAGNHTVRGTTTVDAFVRMNDGTLTGLTNATLAGGSGLFEWTGGWIGGDFTFGIGLPSLLSGNNTKAFLPAAVIHNRGTMRWTGGDIWSPGRSAYAEAPITFHNESGSTFLALNNNAFTTWQNAHTFNNHAGATFVKSNATGTTTCGWFFNNAGTLDLPRGTLALNVVPTALAGGTLRFALGGTTAGVDYGRLALAGAAALSGGVDVSLEDGFAPTNGGTFALVTYGSRSGTFGPLTLPPAPGGLGWFSRYEGTSFTVGTRVTPPCLSLTNGLVAWWPGDSGTNLLGTGDLISANGATNGAGFIGGAFQFDGINDYLSVPDSTNFRPANLTVEGWVSFSSYGGARVLFGKLYGSSQESFLVWLQDTTLYGVVSTPGGFSPFLNHALPMQLGRWYHVALTFDDTNDTQTLYLNGGAVASSAVTGSLVYDSGPFMIGGELENGSPAFFHHGLIDEVTLYNRALSAPEINAIFAADSVGRCPLTVPATSIVQLLNPSWSNGVFRATVTGTSAATRAIVEASSDLSSWEPLQTNAPFTGVLSLEDAGAVATNRFYRIRIEP